MSSDNSRPKDLFQVHWILLAMMVVAFIVSINKFYVHQNYDVFVEAPCDPKTQQCYTRDCSTGNCPPNNLSVYRLYKVPASVFPSCSDNSCANVCKEGSTSCVEVPCSSQSDVDCTSATTTQPTS
jgi:hypothetical protein